MELTGGDRNLLVRALGLAERARRHAAPNPPVGCVIARSSEIVGEGHTQPPGGEHAEAMALRVAGSAARDATAYVTLEPCAHHGRTPPCAEALVASGVRRVVACAEDPFPLVAGAGHGRLRAAGIDVLVLAADDPLAIRARRQQASFRISLGRQRPWVVYKAATSLDGRTATRTGDSRWISGPDSRALVHEWRAEAGTAVLVGIGTVLADDPLLTARDCDPPADRQPLRLVADRSARLPLDSALARSAGDGPVIALVDPAAHAARRHALERAGIETLPGETPAAWLRALCERGTRTVLCEGGATLAAALIADGLCDTIRLFVAPVLVGDPAAPGVVASFAHPDQMRDALRAADLQAAPIGGDVLLEAWLSNP